MGTMELSLNALEKKVRRYEECFQDLLNLCTEKGYNIRDNDNISNSYGYEKDGKYMNGYHTIEQAITACIASWER